MRRRRCSYAQELLYLLSQVFDGGVAYNAPGAFQLEGSSTSIFCDALVPALAERHSILRTTYTQIGGHPMQVIGQAAPIELNVVDLREVPLDSSRSAPRRS